MYEIHKRQSRRPTVTGLRLLFFTILVALLGCGCGFLGATSEPTGINPSPQTYPTQSSTLTPPTTLEPAEAEIAIKRLLEDTADCEAPCFWGIVPGQTTIGEAENIFAMLGLRLNSGSTVGGRDSYETRHLLVGGPAITVRLFAVSNVVTSVKVLITQETYRPGLPRQWSAYSIDNLIHRYGLPSKVDFWLGRGEISSYSMDVYFDTVDLIAEYFSYDVGADENSPNICPVQDKFVSVGLWFGSNPEDAPPVGIPLSEATNMTVHQFSQLMTGSPSLACLHLDEGTFP